jgi:regulator of protease activity HflC (stomatin/prohibitin superfamily)
MNGEPFFKNSRFWRWFIPWGLFVLFIALFWSDVIPAARGWTTLGLVLVGLKEPPVDISLLPSMVKIATNIIMYIGVFLISIFVVAQFVLPVQAWNERWDAFVRLWHHGIKWLRGPAVFVHHGRLISRVGEEDNPNPGVIIADLRSAVVVEQVYPHLGETDDFLEQPTLEKEPVPHQSRGLLRTLRLFRREKEYPIARVLGPGIHFTGWGEKIRCTVDLRRQVQSARGKPVINKDGREHLEPGVKAFTRDGIEVGANCSVVFSLSDPPDIIWVAYWGGNEARHLHEIDCEKKENTIWIKSINRLEESDQEEIHQAVNSARITTLSANATSLSESGALYPLDKSRVFDAAYGQVSGIPTNDKSQWHELPLSIAADIFRNLLERYNFDYLYSVDDPKRLPWMDELKPEFSRRVKHQGILSYQLIRPAGLPRLQAIHWDIHLNGTALNVKLGEKINLDLLEFSNVYPLTSSKSLRDRGIKVVAAGFSELKMPADIHEKLVERWKARWEREIQIVLARQEREAMQIISSARNRAQRDNAYFLTNLFKEEKHSTEALALLIFQSLELAATDLKNQKDLPPKEVLAMLQNLHNWLLRERQEMDDRKRRQKGKDSHGEDDGVIA